MPLPLLATARGLRVALVLAVAATLVLAPLWALRSAWQAGHAAGQAQAAAAHAAAAQAQAAALAQAQQAQQAAHAAAVANAKEIDLAHHAALRAAQRRADAARADAGRLRHALATLATRPADPDPTAAACAQRLADVERHREGLGELLLQSADLVAELAQRGDAAAAALEGLQRHLAQVRQVQLTPPAPPAAAYSPH